MAESITDLLIKYSGAGLGRIDIDRLLGIARKEAEDMPGDYDNNLASVFRRGAQRRLSGVPFEYIRGYTSFMGHRFYVDERVFKLIALCARYDYHTTTVKFPEDVISKISLKNISIKIDNNNSRILLAHCKDDEFIPFENLYQIKDHLGLDDKNIVVYETGGHSFKGHREEIIQKTIDFINT